MSKKKQQYTRERVEVIFRLRDKTSKGETREDLLKDSQYKHYKDE